MRYVFPKIFQQRLDNDHSSWFYEIGICVLKTVRIIAGCGTEYRARVSCFQPRTETGLYYFTRTTRRPCADDNTYFTFTLGNRAVEGLINSNTHYVTRCVTDNRPLSAITRRTIADYFHVNFRQLIPRDAFRPDCIKHSRSLHSEKSVLRRTII